MVLCSPGCECEHCYLLLVYHHPRFKKNIQNMVEIYKSMSDLNYFPIEIVEKDFIKSKL